MDTKLCMTVNQLIETLQKLVIQNNVGELPVVTEGCDCLGECNRIEIDIDGKESYVLLRRS